MDPAAAKQQVAERVKQANKFLVTVNANPTVDQLAACIGLTLLLNKIGKHATAVFSGRVPSTIEFLQPEKTLEQNTDSLRDFIISLDKNKADKLRYKVEDDVVRIFITPYRTSISEHDLVFSEGDFNVEAVMALGVTQRGQLDAAITAHGRILHDATVISINAGSGRAPDLGQINWQDEQASSLSEMLVSISEAFGPGLIDSQIATAFLTGIVAETQRFSNKKTSPKVMTMSAQLMAAGANQQLIVSKLEPPPPPPPPPPKPPAPPPKPPEPKKPKPPQFKPEGEIDIQRANKKNDNKPPEQGITEIHIDEQGNLVSGQEVELQAEEHHEEHHEQLQQQMPPPLPAVTMSSPPPGPPEPLPTPPPPPMPPMPPMPPEPPPPPEPLPPPPPLQQDDLSADGNPLPTLPPVHEPPHIKHVKPATPVPVENNHAFLGSTAQPGGLGIPFRASTSSQPDWASPYDLVPNDPLQDQGATASEFGSTPVTTNPENVPNNFGQGHAVAPPGTPVQATPVAATPVDNARNAVQSAIVGAPFDPGYEAPVESLNAQPLSQPLHEQAAAPTAAPTMKNSDTPMLVLPTDGNGPVSATPPPIAQTPLTAQSSGPTMPAPPPVPPPLPPIQ